MHKLIVVFLFPLFFVPESGNADTETDVSETEVQVLRTSFEEPLQRELLRKGFSPRNAGIATQNILDNLVECWASDRNSVAGEEQETILVRLGGRVILTYPSPCIDDLLSTVSEVTR